MPQLRLSIRLSLWDNHRMGWATVPGYAGYYEAHDELQAVRSLDRIIVDKNGNFRCLRGKMLAGPRLNVNTVILSRSGIQEHLTVAEVLERTFNVAAVA